jgi:hypothetical protein
MTKIGEFFSGGFNGFLSLFGLGQFSDPLGDERSKISSIKDNIQNLTTLGSIQSAKNTNTSLENIIKLNNVCQKSISETINQTNTFVNDSLQQENLFISFLYILLFILIFFFLAQKKCC